MMGFGYASTHPTALKLMRRLIVTGSLKTYSRKIYSRLLERWKSMSAKCWATKRCCQPT
jgi:hypothetical protein